MTSEQISQNRANAIASVRASLGLNNTPSSWTLDQRNTYNKSLATFIATHPEQFGTQDIENAEYVAKNPIGGLVDDSFQWTEFAAETVKPLSDSAVSVGQGVFSVLKASKWAIPVVVVIVVVLGLFAFRKRLAA